MKQTIDFFINATITDFVIGIIIAACVVGYVRDILKEKK